ncbi:hypothetical protein FN846DRAFT_148069 [Sphaerosporella brunnea]|uniref:Oxidoreductase acuF-like C2H2 type zinc-finger domain-containing protein n=1 Tax=Sphaerosporella brunnea TaxID=1250544 RepID=A0A5J5ER27_9PEZI|nr:hypothetical protein FN846DRAFT_148069 [Sphaerosporella brunnea]
MFPGVGDSDPEAQAPDSESTTEIDDTSDGSSSDTGTDADQITYLVDSLYRLLPALEESLDEIVARNLKARQLLQAGTITDMYSTVIRDKYPRAEANLVSRLAQGVVDASRRLELLSRAGARSVGPISVGKLSAAPATDSGLGSSLGDSLAESVVSDLSDLLTVNALDPKYRNLCLPSMPTGGAECPICLQKLSIRNNKQWKLHAFNDLMPYMCISSYTKENQCQQSFKTWRQWMEHDARVHAAPPIAHKDDVARPCPFGCRVLRHTSGEGWYRHVGHHMEDVRLLALRPSLRLPSEEYLDGDASDSSRMGNETPVDAQLGGLSMITEEKPAPSVSASSRMNSIALSGCFMIIPKDAELAAIHWRTTASSGNYVNTVDHCASLSPDCCTRRQSSFPRAPSPWSPGKGGRPPTS